MGRVFAITAAVFAADFVTKICARKSTVFVIQNSGVSFGLLKHTSSVAVVLLNVAVAAALCFVALCFAKREKSANSCAISLMFGGCLGNLCDRLIFGCVTDWIYLPFSTLLFQNGLWLNIADFAIIAGFCLTAAQNINFTLFCKE